MPTHATQCPESHHHSGDVLNLSKQNTKLSRESTEDGSPIETLHKQMSEQENRLSPVCSTNRTTLDIRFFAES